jgi:beta-glucanase (GH16 family)
MALSAPSGFTSSDLVFQDDFSGTTLDSTWHNYITSNAAHGSPWNSSGSGGSGPGGAYDADYDMPSQVSVNNGTLDLTASKQTVSGANQGSAQTFPITSGAVSSYGNFEFTGGYLQISMKAPSGDGAWPGLWLLPGKGAGSSGDNFEIDMQEGGYTGSGPANQAFSAHLHTPSGTFGSQVDSGVDLTAAYHTYGINWVPGKSITWYLDGKQMAQVTSAQTPIPTEPMELIMDSQVANSNAAGWHTALDSSTPSSTQMLINGVQLYQLPGSGGQVTGANVSATTPPVTTPPVTTPPVTTPPVTTPPAIQPAVTQATASPGSGVEHVGATVALTLGFNEAVTVTGKPTLTLNDGSTATYVSGSGTNALIFHTTVASTNTATSALAVTAVNLASGASIKDTSGLSANLSGAAKTFSGLQIDPTLATTPPVTTPPVTTPPVTTPPVTTPPAIQPAVTQATASPGSGVEHVGATVALTLGFNEAVTVTGKPTLTLNDGSTATYVSGSGTNALIFHTTVASTNTATSALAVTAVNLASGASIKDASGLSANLSGAAKTFSGLQIDPTPVTIPPVTTPPVTTPPVTTPPAIQPAVTQATASPGSGVEHVGATVALTLGFNEAVTVTGKPTLALNDGSTATYVSGSGTNALVFHTTIASTNTATSALAVTAVNLASGASIKDASGLSANLSGAAKTFSGLQIDPTPATTPPVTTPPVTTPPVTTPPVASDPAPALSVADHSLSVHGHGGTVDLGLSVKSSDPNDAVSVNIKGLPRYETITDNLDHHTFTGKDITLTAAEVDSGLTLRSHYWGSGHPVATLAATATAKDPTTGAVTTSAPQTITVTDPPATTATSPSHADHSFALLNQYLAAGGFHGQVDHGQIATAVSQASNWLNESLLTRPQH